MHITSAHVLYMGTLAALPLLDTEKAYFFVSSFRVHELHCQIFDLLISQHTEN